MPAQSGLDDASVAAVLNHVGTVIAKSGPPFKAFHCKGGRHRAGQRTAITAADVARLHATVGGDEAGGAPWPVYRAGAAASRHRSVPGRQRRAVFGDAGRGASGAGAGRLHAQVPVAAIIPMAAAIWSTPPPLRGEVAKFLVVPGGREFLGRCLGSPAPTSTTPGEPSCSTGLSTLFDRQHLPAGFQPYSPGELAKLRKAPLRLERAEMRAGLVRAIENHQKRAKN
ncbi:MAG: hypothetical protein R3E03_02680 [Novosphingobium sp.]